MHIQFEMILYNIININEENNVYTFIRKKTIQINFEQWHTSFDIIFNTFPNLFNLNYLQYCDVSFVEEDFVEHKDEKKRKWTTQ
jgi:hypothetical protein